MDLAVDSELLAFRRRSKSESEAIRVVLSQSPKLGRGRSPLRRLRPSVKQIFNKEKKSPVTPKPSIDTREWKGKGSLKNSPKRKQEKPFLSAIHVHPNSSPNLLVKLPTSTDSEGESGDGLFESDARAQSLKKKKPKFVTFSRHPQLESEMFQHKPMAHSSEMLNKSSLKAILTPQLEVRHSSENSLLPNTAADKDKRGLLPKLNYHGPQLRKLNYRDSC